MRMESDFLYRVEIIRREEGVIGFEVEDEKRNDDDHGPEEVAEKVGPKPQEDIDTQEKNRETVGGTNHITKGQGQPHPLDQPWPLFCPQGQIKRDGQHQHGRPVLPQSSTGH